MISIINFLKNQNKILLALIISLIQLGIFILSKSYILYLLVGIVFILSENFLIIKNKVYEIKNNLINRSNELDSSNIKFQFDRTKQFEIIKKASELSLDYTDTIIISITVGRHASLLYSNYNIILSSFTNILKNIYEVIIQKAELLNSKFKINSTIIKVFILTILAIIIYSITSLVLSNFLNYFIKNWIGPKYILKNSVVSILILDFCFAGILFAIIKNKKLLKLSKNKKTDPLLTLVINIITSLILSILFGIIGVILGSILSKAILNIGYELLEVYQIHTKKIS